MRRAPAISWPCDRREHGAAPGQRHVLELGKSGPYGGGIWGWGGVSIDPSGSGNVYTATGDALFHPENVHYSDAVVELTGRLAVVASNKPPLDVKDADFGSTPVPIQAAGCPPQLVVLNKDGDVFLYNRADIGSGPVQTVAISYVRSQA